MLVNQKIQSIIVKCRRMQLPYANWQHEFFGVLEKWKLYLLVPKLTLNEIFLEESKYLPITRAKIVTEILLKTMYFPKKSKDPSEKKSSLCN